MFSKNLLDNLLAVLIYLLSIYLLSILAVDFLHIFISNSGRKTRHIRELVSCVGSTPGE